jgi:hypothetical protein
MKNTLICTAVALLVILSCKKKEDPKPAATNSGTTTATTTTGGTTGGTTTGGTTTGGTTTGGTTTGGTTGTPTSSATKFHGILTVTSATLATGAQNMTAKTGSAFFTGVPANFPQGPDGIRVKKVSLNGDSLTFFDSTNDYQSGGFTNMSGSKWEVEGNTSIPSFTFDAGFGEPACTNIHLLPKIISKAAGINLTLTVTNIKTGSIIITDNSGSINGTFVLQLVNGTNNVTITAGQMNGFIKTTNATLMLQLENNSNHLIGGKDFSFRKSLFVMNQVEIKD